MESLWGEGEERERPQGEEVGLLAAPLDLGEVLLIVWSFERLGCGKAPPKYIGRPRRSVYLSVFTLLEINTGSTDVTLISYDTEFNIRKSI